MASILIEPSDMSQGPWLPDTGHHGGEGLLLAGPVAREPPPRCSMFGDSSEPGVRRSRDPEADKSKAKVVVTVLEQAVQVGRGGGAALQDRRAAEFHSHCLLQCYCPESTLQEERQVAGLHLHHMDRLSGGEEQAGLLLPSPAAAEREVTKLQLPSQTNLLLENLI